MNLPKDAARACPGDSIGSNSILFHSNKLGEFWTVPGSGSRVQVHLAFFLERRFAVLRASYLLWNQKKTKSYTHLGTDLINLVFLRLLATYRAIENAPSLSLLSRCFVQGNRATWRKSERQLGR